MSKRKKVWVVVFLAVALVVLIPLGLRWQAQWQLRSYRKKLIAAGEKLTVAELAPKRNAPATNTARFLRLASALPSLGNYAPSAMLSVSPGVARVAWRQTQCLEESMDFRKPRIDVWPALIGAVRTNEPAFDELQALVEAGGIDFIEDYSQQNLSGNTYLSWLKKLVMGLSARAMLALHQGQRGETCDDLKFCDAAFQLMAKDPIVIDQLVMYACVNVVAGDYWEALQAGDWTEDQLAQWQHQWDQPAILAAAESTLAMERARAAGMFQIARTSRDGLNDLMGSGSSALLNNAEIWSAFLLNPRHGINELLTSYPRYWGWRWIWSYRDEQRYMEFMQSTIEATRDAQKGRSILSLFKDRKASTTPTPLKTTTFDLAAAATADIEPFVARALRAQTVVNMVTTAIALERFRLAHHAYPEALANLTPDFVPAVPVDCMDGHSLRYRLNPDGTYLLYSVGVDGIDNGGNPRPERGVRMSFFNGRDWVWPRTATAQEVQIYEVKQSNPLFRR